MFRFEDPDYLYLLVLIPLLALIYFFMMRSRNKKLCKLGDTGLLRQLMPDVSKWRPVCKFCIMLTALALIIIMVARPQMGTKISTEKRVGIETVIAMDISNSMRAEDVAPSRLDRSKMMVENLVDKFVNDKIGLIVFAGDAFVQLPITSDYVSAKMFLGSIDPSMMASQGTDIAAAIDLASHSFTQQEGVGKAIIIITDGEDHEGRAIEAAKAVKERGMSVFVLGVGSVAGAPIPVPGTHDYMKDNAGNTVVSVLNKDMCRQLASAGGGAYIHVDNNSNAQDLLDKELDKLAKKEISSNVYSDYDEQFPALAVIVLLLLVIEICLLECKNPLLKGIRLFGSKKALMFAAMTVCVLTAAAQTDRQHVRDGNKKFRAGDYEGAEVEYQKAVELNPRNPQATYNLGNALLAQNKDSAAIEKFQTAAKLETNPMRKSMAYHNQGVVCQKHKMYGDAIEQYKEALRLNPYDDMTRYNLALCKRMQKQEEQNKNKQNKDNKDDKKDDKDKQKKDEEKKNDDKQKNDKQDKKDEKNDKMSKDNAEQLLNAAMQQEKDTQRRMNKAMQQPGSRKLQKNW